MQQQPEEKQRLTEREGWYHFTHSNYITWFTDWLLGFGGKSAQPILIITTLYMGAELYPGVNLPPGLNLAVFLIQLFALDMGGIGLGALAKQAERDGNAQGAKKAQTFSRALITIFVVGIVTVGLKQVIAGLNVKDQHVLDIINVTETCIELVLVVARCVGAVLYGKVIHDLESDGYRAAPVSPGTQKTIQAMQEELKALADRLAEMQKSVQPLSLLPAKLTEIESRFALSIANIERQIETLTPFNLDEIERHTDAKLKAFSLSIESKLKGEIETLDLSIERANSEKLKGISEEIERQIESKLKGWIERQIERGKVTISEVPPSSTPKKAPIPIAARAKAVSQPTPPLGKREFVFRCLEDDPQMSIADIQKKAEDVGLSLSIGTISTYRKAFNSGETEREDDEIESAG